jgi:hypothetical protein
MKIFSRYFLSFRQKYNTRANSISTRSFVHHASTVSTPSLPDDSQTIDDLLNKI